MSVTIRPMRTRTGRSAFIETIPPGKPVSSGWIGIFDQVRKYVLLGSALFVAPLYRAQATEKVKYPISYAPEKRARALSAIGSACEEAKSKIRRQRYASISRSGIADAKRRIKSRML